MKTFACLSPEGHIVLALKEGNVTAGRQRALVDIRVHDFGEGISPEKLEHIFDCFCRGDEAFTIPGFGLGCQTSGRVILVY